MKNVKRITLAIVITTLVLLTGCGTNPPFSQKACEGMNPAEVEEAFKEAGFTTVKVADKETTDEEKDGTIYSVNIEGWSSFSNNSACKSTDEVTITKYVLKTFEPTIKLDVEGQQGKPKFIVKSNLPDKTKLTLTISDDDGYMDRQEIQVKNGEAATKEFEQDNGYPLAGDYTITIVMLPENQKGSIQNEIGTSGGALKGELIETNPESGSKYVFYETTYHSPYTEGETESALTPDTSLEDVAALIDADLAVAFSNSENNHYTIETEEGGITITTWTDGVATVAAAAKLGDDSSIEAWSGLTENTRAAAQRLQENYLDAYGYSDRIVLMNIANDLDTSKMLYQTCKGLVIYDYVSGIGEDN